MQYSELLSVVILCIFLAGPAVAKQNSTVEGTGVDQGGSAVQGALIKVSSILKGFHCDAQGFIRPLLNNDQTNNIPTNDLKSWEISGTWKLHLTRFNTQAPIYIQL